MQITYYGHACFGVETNGINLLFDPFISGNELASDIDINRIPADYILLTHGHQDHVLDVEAIAKRTGAKVITNFEIMNWLNGKGIDNVHPMNHGGAFSFDFGRVRYVTAVHSSMLPDGANGGNPGGFIVELEEGPTFYYSGDTALTWDMKLFAQRHVIDFAFLCIGDNFTMDAVDAATAAEFVGTDTVIGMHYDTFPPIEIDHDRARQAFHDKGKSLALPKIGETLSFDELSVAV
jgi:L-ascorbate metabolism protein UlaG (beta-lactamase superfamily)